MSENLDKELLNLIADLVQIPTENPPGDEGPCGEFVHEWFEEKNISSTLVRDPYENRPQVVAKVGKGEPNLVLNGHIDAVPAGDVSEWKHHPYDAVIEDGKMFGRGCCDMKANVAIAMMVMADLRESIENNDLDGSLTVQVAIGEETGEPGTKRLLELGHDGDYGVVLEPTGMCTATSEKGLAWYEIIVEREPCHASQPDQGVNAIQEALPVIQKLNEYDENVRKREDELVGSGHSTITNFEAGTKENVVPGRAMLSVDRRFLPSESVEEIDEEISSLLDEVEKNHDVTTSWERTKTYESAAIDKDSSLAEIFRKHSKEIGNVSAEPHGTKFSTDVRNFVNDFDIEAITWGPHDPSEAHTVDECISLDETRMGLDVLEHVVRDILSCEID